MNLSMRHFVVGSFLFSLVGIGLFAYPSLAEEAGIDFWNVPEYQRRIRSAQQRREELDRKDKIVLQRTILKVEVVEQLIAGVWTFEEAVTRFETINRTMPTGMPAAGPEPGRTDREKAAFQLVRYLRSLNTPQSKLLAERLAQSLRDEQ